MVHLKTDGTLVEFLQSVVDANEPDNCCVGCIGENMPALCEYCPVNMEE